MLQAPAAEERQEHLRRLLARWHGEAMELAAVLAELQGELAFCSRQAAMLRLSGTEAPDVLLHRCLDLQQETAAVGQELAEIRMALDGAAEELALLHRPPAGTSPLS